ncbi:MAG: phosphotransferase [Lachnospiraceae bacterium]|nr:phosphotransferase [Lachnospiraceae bacterium]
MRNGWNTVSLPERVDAQNYEEVRRDIAEAAKEYKDDQSFFLYLDAKKTIYISSVGIRTILMLKKEIQNIAVVNVNPSLYGILALTGMNNIIIVVPPIEEITLDGCQEISSGLNSRVYRMDEDKICKLFEPRNGLRDVLMEKQMSLKAIQAGLPTALSFQVVTCSGRYGVVYELLRFTTLSEVVREHPEQLDEVVREYVGFLNDIHGTVATQFPKAKKYYESKVLDAIGGYIDEPHAGALFKVFEGIPEGQGFIHGDPHFANLFRNEEGLMFVDLDSVRCGDPVWDLVALHGTMISLRIFNEIDVLHLGSVARYPALWEMIIDEYVRQNGSDRESLYRITETLSYGRALVYAVRHGTEGEKIQLIRDRLYRALGW